MIKIQGRRGELVYLGSQILANTYLDLHTISEIIERERRNNRITKQTKNGQWHESIGSPADDVIRRVQLVLLRPPGPRSPGDAGGGGGRGTGRAAAAPSLGGRDGAAAGDHGPLVEGSERVVPAAEPRLVLERLHRRHARRHHQRRRLLAHRQAHISSVLHFRLILLTHAGAVSRDSEACFLFS